LAKINFSYSIKKKKYFYVSAEKNNFTTRFVKGLESYWQNFLKISPRSYIFNIHNSNRRAGYDIAVITTSGCIINTGKDLNNA